MIEDSIAAEMVGVYAQLTEDELGELAESKGCTLVLGNSKSLLLDLDSPQAINAYETLLGLAGKLFYIIKTEKWLSIHGNMHVMITLGREEGAIERILMQACLGSDPKRELIHLHELWNFRKPNICLFKPK